MGRIPNEREIEKEIWRRRKEENDEILRLLCENTPEAKARIAELDARHHHEKEEKKKAINDAITMRSIYETNEAEVYNKTVDNIINHSSDGLPYRRFPKEDGSRLHRLRRNKGTLPTLTKNCKRRRVQATKEILGYPRNT